PPERLERLEDAQLLRDVIDGIPEPYRSVLCTLFLGGEPPVYEKAAREIHVPRNSISQIMARALDLLRRRLLRLRKNQIFFVSAPD
ncbi:MAG: hypothetical protein ACE5GW_09655, partial [Planctomycetota bacterium]